MKTILHFIQINRIILIGMLFGLIFGYIHWFYFGCYWGSYPMSSVNWVNTLAGMFFGGLVTSLLDDDRFV